MNKKVAYLISRVFDPVVEIPLLIGAAVYLSVMNGYRWRFLVLLLVVDAIVPAVFMLWGLKSKRISDWDMTKRQERGGIYFVTVVAHLFGVVLAFYLGKIALAKLLLVFWSLATIFALITAMWKISVHGGVNGALVAFFNYIYGWRNYWWLVIVLLMVLWSRVASKKHSFMQAVVGASLAVVWVELGLKLLGVREGL